MMSILVSWVYMYVSVDYHHDVYLCITVLHICQCWLPQLCLSLYHGSTCMSVLITSMMSIFVWRFYMYVSVDYLHDVYHSIMGLHVCQCWLPPWYLSLYHSSTCMSVLITSMLSIFVSWFYMYVGVDYLHNVYLCIMVLHVCQCWLPPWCLSLYHGSICMSVLITSMMSIFVSWFYMYVSIDYLHDVYLRVSWFYIYASVDYLLGVYHNHMRIQEGQSCTLQFCLPLPHGATGEIVFFTSMISIITL